MRGEQNWNHQISQRSEVEIYKHAGEFKKIKYLKKIGWWRTDNLWSYERLLKTPKLKTPKSK